jgi:(2Fe-2S) ferredoxin
MSSLQRPAREVTLERACSHVSAARGEALPGTASTVRDWVLVEQPGAWGQDAVVQSDLPVTVGRELQRRADAAAARLLLIRRPGRDRGAPTRSAYVIHSGPGVTWQRRVTFRDPAELLELDLAAVRRPGDEVGHPLYAVCTNGKHDLCCAVAGLPLARSLAGLADVWECSHVGGDRFAANLVCFPEGLYYGRVTPAAGREILQEHQRGRLVLDHFRGRAGQSFAAQAAESFLRREHAVTGLDDVRLRHHLPVDGGAQRFSFVVDVDGPAGRTEMSVDVSIDRAAPARRLTCRGEATNPPAYRTEWATA